MKILSVCGISQSGKTTTIEHIIRELVSRGFRVGSVKEIHFETFALDNDPNSNTSRHRSAGSELVTARGLYETDIMFPRKLEIPDILAFYHGFDYVIMEGVSDIPLPTILTAQETSDLEQKWNGHVCCVSGIIADKITEYNGIPAISAISGSALLADLIEQKVCHWVHGSDSCPSVTEHTVEFYIGGQRMDLVPSAQKSLQKTLLDIAGGLNNYKEGLQIVVKVT